jgi:hypothetical protein
MRFAIAIIALEACGRPVEAHELEGSVRVASDALSAAGLKSDGSWTVPVTLGDLPKPEDGREKDYAITISQRITGDLVSVLLHEYGHALGLPHSSDPMDVMWGEPGDPLEPDVAARQLREACGRHPGGCVKLGGMRFEVKP